MQGWWFNWFYVGMLLSLFVQMFVSQVRFYWRIPAAAVTSVSKSLLFILRSSFCRTRA